VQGLSPSAQRVVSPAGAAVDAASADAQPVPQAEKSSLGRALQEGRRVVAVELEPPKGHDAAAAIADARRFAARGVDLVTVSDGLRSGARMSALSLAVLVQQAAGLEPALQYSCRDRYLLGIQSDLLGAHAIGVRNLILFTGDPRKRGDYSDATLVFDVDSIGLTNVVSRLNHGRDVGGQPIGDPTAFLIGVVANPTSPRLDDEVRRFEYKVQAGAEYAVTTPIYDLEALDEFLRRVDHVRVPIIAAIRPFESLLHAEYLANEVPNLRVPEALIARMRRADAAGTACDEGVLIARELAEAVRTRVQGLQVAGPPAGILAVLEG
jgi:homocysteine S-methyltransferase